MSDNIWDVINEFIPTKSPIQSIDCLSDNKTLVIGAASTENENPTLLTLNLISGEIINVFENSDNYNNAIWKVKADYKDNNIIYLIQNDSDAKNFKIINYNIKKNNKFILYELENLAGLSGFDISPDNKFAIAIENVISFWDIDNNKKIRELTLNDKKTIIDEYSFTSIAFSKNNELMAIGGINEGEILLYNLKTNEIINKFIGSFSFPRKIMFDNNEHIIVADYWTKGVYIWNINTANRFQEDYYNEDMEKIASFGLLNNNNDNFFLIGMNTSVVKMIDFNTQKRIIRDKLHKGRITDLLITRDNKYIISASEDWKLIVRAFSL